MKNISTKESAEAVLRELPSVLGASVREDIHGHPREVHLLVGPGPNVRNLARDIKELLEEKLHIPVDQRVISIAQLTTKSAAAQFQKLQTGDLPPALPEQYRVNFSGIETSLQGSRAVVRVRIGWAGQEFVGEAVEVDAGTGRIRAAAAATLEAATLACRTIVRMELESASLVRALQREYVLVAALAASPMLGRRPLPLSGAHAIEEDAASSACYAALKSVNRVMELALKSARERGL